MCGISFVFDRASRAESARTLLRMHAPIAHRGPDGEGVLFVDSSLATTRFDDAHAAVAAAPLVGIAFRRLSIVDLSDAASQPMASPDGRLWIAFNGEIYNFRELRAELAAQGRVFRSSGDTEVVLAAYEAWGERCFERLEGMWAIVLVDLARRRIVASRDRFGIKPLLWSMDGDRLLLASEAKQLVAAADSRPRANAALVRRHLLNDRLPALEETFFEGIRAIPPATWCEFSLEAPPPREPRFHRYWDLAAFHPNGHLGGQRNGQPRDYEATKRELRALLESAVDRERVADVPIGALLSGGLDSSILTSLLLDLHQREGRPLPAVSLGFREAAPEACELQFVDSMKGRAGLVNVETTFDAAWVARHTGDVVRALEEPPLAFAALAQYRTFQACREAGLKVIVDGQGADEIFAGYPYHERLVVLDALRHGRIGAFSREVGAIAKKHRTGRASLLARGLVLPYVADAVRRTPWLDPAYGRGLQEEVRFAKRDGGDRGSLLHRRLFFDVRWANVKIVLGYGDRNSMAHSIESRVPYFDRRVVELAFSLPDSFLIAGGDRKRILRDVGREVLPRAITERADRMGFNSPEARMLRDELWPSIRSEIGDFLRTHRGVVRAAGVEKLLRERRRTRDVWRIYALAVWAREFDVLL
jgi:asparagine synthase (glutamine-hydrolysing)